MKTTNRTNLTKNLDRIFYACILLLAISAPVSIAATQTAWALAIFFWLIRLAFERPSFRRDGFTLALLTFVGLTLISSFFSYEPEVSLRKMVAVSLVSIVYLVSAAVKGAMAIRRVVVVLLLVSASVAAIYTLGLTAVGRNLKVTRLAPDSVLLAAGVKDNDTIISAGGVSVSSPDELARAAARLGDGPLRLRVYRYEAVFDVEIPRAPVGTDAAAAYGIASWSRGRDVRAAGFYGHYTTYAESLQLIASVALGLLILVPGGLFSRFRLLLAAALACFSGALFLTVTRASWAGFAISAALIVLIGASRKVILICILCAVPLAAAGGFYLQQKRNVGFVDAKDGSTTWRTTVWREAIGVLVSDPRHLVVGVGMDSIKTQWPEWKMFDNGRQPMGHMHSNPIQFALERGVPALIAWIVWMFLYLRMLWRGIGRRDLAWPERGLLLGCLGGTAGFLASGLVHYNWGDSEVVMIFYLLMGLSLSIMTPPSNAEARL